MADDAEIIYPDAVSIIDPRKQAMIECLKACLGVIAPAIALLEENYNFSITRNTHLNWRKTDDDYKEHCEEITEVANDFVEHAIMRGIKTGNVPLMIFYAKTKMRKRGFSEKYYLSEHKEDEDKTLDELEREIAEIDAQVAEIKEIETTAGGAE